MSAHRNLTRKTQSATKRSSRAAHEAVPGKTERIETVKTGQTLATLMQQYPGTELATLVDAPPAGDQWLHEIKLDGYRLLAFLANGAVKLITRNGNDWTAKFASISAAIGKLKAKQAVLDMEAVVMDADGKSSFQAMQRALGDGGKPEFIKVYVFDLLHLDGLDVSGEQTVKRKQKLETLLKESAAALRYSDHIIGHGEDMIAKACTMGLEGVLSKRADAPYRRGRQTDWLKSKCIKRQEFVIVGYTAARSGDRAIGALHLGYSDGAKLKYAGKVGTGFGMKTAEELHDRLSKLAIGSASSVDVPRSVLKTAHWVQPQLLCEVSFTEWTEDGHIRHPSFQGLREDKKAADVTMEKPVHLKNSGAPKKKAEPHEIRGVRISNPDRVIFKDNGVTKGDLAKFYAAAAPWILKDLGGHPVSLLRCPEGTAGDCFYQRNPGTGLGADVKPFRWKHKGKSYEYLYIEEEKGLIEFVQMGAIELHPWGARVEKIDYPDRMIFDLDPAPDVPFDAVKLAARDLRHRLESRGLACFLKCTGGKGRIKR
jgi:bifunctional non-homologous end joining protein LigD